MKGSGGALEDALVRVREPFETGAIRGSGAWVAAFRVLTFPALLFGREHRYSAERDGDRLAVVCVGFRRRFDAMVQELFEGAAYRGPGRRRYLGNPRRLAHLGDIVLVDVHASFVGAFERADWLIVPETVRWAGHTSGLPDADPSESLRADIRKIDRFEYSFEEAGTPSDWLEFFDSMVIPHLRLRFGDAARLPSAATRRWLRGHARLFFVIRDGRRVSGGCLLTKGGGVILRRVGVRDGDETLLREGALTALYLFLFDWAREEGHEEFDSGETLPLPRSGLARFKAKLGLEASCQPGGLTTGLHYDAGNPAIAALFDDHPIMRLVAGRLEVHP